MNIDTSEFHRHIIRAIRQRITVSAPSISFLLIAGISLAWTVSSWAENKCTVKDSYAHIQNPALVLMDSRMMPQTSPSLLVSTSEAVTMGLPLSRPPLPELGSVHIGSSVCAQGLLPEDCNDVRRDQAARTGNIKALIALSPRDLSERILLLRKRGVLATAFQSGSVDIVKQILVWDPDAINVLAQGEGGWLLKHILTGWSLEAKRNRRAGEPTQREQDFLFLVKLLLSTATLKDTPEGWGSALASLADMPLTVEVNDVAVILLERGASIESRGSFQRTALSLAAESNNMVLVKRMLEIRKASQAALDEAIVWTSLTVKPGILELLLTNGANVNVDGANFGKAEHRPAGEAAGLYKYAGTREPIALLIRHKVDPNKTLPDLRSALMTVMHDHELMRGLLDLGANPNQQDVYGDTPLLHATRLPTQVLRESGDSRPINRIEPGLDPEMRRRSVEMLLQYGADPKVANKAGVMPLSQTTAADAAAITLLVSKGATVNGPQYGAFFNQTVDNTKTGVVASALLNRNDALAAALLARETRLSPDDCGAVYYAAQTGSTLTLEALLDRKANVYAATASQGKTPLHIAAAEGQLAAVRLLLARRVSKVDETTPFELRSCGGPGFASECVRGRQTALMFAVAGGHNAVVEELIARGADVNRRDYSGTKVLGYVNSANSSLKKILMSHGAN